MAGDIQITITVNGDNMEAIDTASQKIDTLGKSGQTAASGMDSLKSTMGEFTAAAGIVAGIGLTIDKIDELGKSAYLATAGLNSLSGGQAQSYMDAMSKSTGGLVSQMDLAQAATLGLSSGIATTATQMAEIASIGTVLGETFQGSATTGMETFERILEMAGNQRGLKQLGIDAPAVMAIYKNEMDQGIEKTKAWSDAVTQVAGTLANTLQPAVEGQISAWDRLKVSIGDAAAVGEENFAVGLNAALQGTADIANHLIQEFTEIQKITFVLPGQLQMPADFAQNGMGMGGGGSAGSPATIIAQQNADFQNTLNNILGQQAVAAGAFGGRDSLGSMTGGAPRDFGGIEQIAAQGAEIGKVKNAWDIANAAAGSYNDTLRSAKEQMGGMVETITRMTSIQQSLGVTVSGGVAGQMESGLQGVLAGASKADQAAAMQAYNLAMGLATPASVEFDRIQTQLAESVKRGSTSAQLAAQEYIAMAKAMQSGTTSAADLDAIMASSHFAGGRGGTEHGVVATSATSGEGNVHAAAADPFASTVTSAGKATTAVAQITTTSAQMAAQVPVHGIIAGAGLAPIAVEAGTVQSHITSIPPKTAEMAVAAVVHGAAAASGFIPLIGTLSLATGGVEGLIRRFMSMNGMTVTVNVRASGGGGSGVA